MPGNSGHAYVCRLQSLYILEAYNYQTNQGHGGGYIPHSNAQSVLATQYQPQQPFYSQPASTANYQVSYCPRHFSEMSFNKTKGNRSSEPTTQPTGKCFGTAS